MSTNSIRHGDGRLRLDLDAGREQPDNHELETRLRRAGYEIAGIWRRPSPSGEGEHITIELAPEPASEMEIVALQAVCGSDPFREACNVQRVRNLDRVPEWWRERWNVLYAPGGRRETGAV